MSRLERPARLPTLPEGESGPLEEFIRQEQRRLIRLLYALTGDWHTAQDLAQDAFAEVALRWLQVSHLNNPAAWLCRVAINKQHRWHRRRHLEENALERKVAASRDRLDMPEDAVEVWDAVRRLPSKQAEVVALRYLADLSVAAIAEVLQIPIGTVKSRLHYAHQTLAKWLGEDAEGGSR